MSFLTVAGIYAGHQNQPLINEDIQNLIDTGNLIIAGDWNAPHTALGHRNNSARGNIVMQAVNSNYHFIGPTTPSRPDYSDGILDYAISDISGPRSTCHTLTAINSDHLPIRIAFEIPIIVHKKQTRNLSKVDWTKF